MSDKNDLGILRETNGFTKGYIKEDVDKYIKNLVEEINKLTEKTQTLENELEEAKDKLRDAEENLASAKKASLKYNVDCFKKDVSKGFFNKLKSKYKGEYLLAEEYSQLALSVKVYHTKCGSEFYTKSSTLLRKRPSCPFCEYKDYIASKKK